MNYAAAEISLKHYDSAIGALQHALDLKPDYHQARYVCHVAHPFLFNEHPGNHSNGTLYCIAGCILSILVVLHLGVSSLMYADLFAIGAAMKKTLRCSKESFKVKLTIVIT